jgi:hypothetical protein
MRPDMSDWSARLAALEAFGPPAAGWRGVIAAREAREAREARASLVLPVAAAACVLAVAAGLGFWLQSAQRALVAGAAPSERATFVAADMRAKNERLERLLAMLPERHAMRGSTAFTIAELEDRLAFLDDRLSRVTLEPNAPERAEQLWHERVEVMNSLVQVRYADTVGTY